MGIHSRVSRPPRYVIMTPILFNAWESWASITEDEKNSTESMLDKSQDTSIRPLGEHVAPDWVKYEFKNLEDFYQHYTKLLNIGD